MAPSSTPPVRSCERWRASCADPAPSSQACRAPLPPDRPAQGRRRYRGAPHRPAHRGRYFDLKEVFDDLNHRYFDGRLRAFVTWGRRTKAKGRSRSIHFGSYNWTRQVIRITPTSTGASSHVTSSNRFSSTRCSTSIWDQRGTRWTPLRPHCGVPPARAGMVRL